MAGVNGWLGEVAGLKTSLEAATGSWSASTGCATGSPPARRPRHHEHASRPLTRGRGTGRGWLSLPGAIMVR